MRSTTVGGSLQAYKNSGRIEFRSNPLIKGNIEAHENTSSVTIDNNQTDANLQVFKNTGGLTITNNVIAENLQCVDNRPPLVEAGNMVGGQKECSSTQ